MKAAVLIFANDPLAVLETGQQPDPLALALLKDTIRNMNDADADVFVFLPPDMDKAWAKQILGPGKYKLANALGRNLYVQQRNAFRLVFVRAYEKAILVVNAAPDLPGHAIASALAKLGWKSSCLGPTTDAETLAGEHSVYAIGFDIEGNLPESFDQVERNRENFFTRLETFIMFFARTMHVLPAYTPVRSLDDAAALAKRCAGTRFALLPSVRLATERSGS
jgi:hypothetical protein